MLTSLFLAYFAFLFGEGDAAGEGLAAGLGLVAGTVPIALPGEGEVAGDVAAPGEFELFSVSVAQPTANMLARMIGSRRMMLLMDFNFELLIVLASFEQD